MTISYSKVILLFMFLFKMISFSAYGGASIQQLIDNANDGDTIFLESHIYKVKEPIRINNKKNIKIEGIGFTKIINVSDKRTFSIYKSTNITLDNMVIENEKKLYAIFHIGESKNINIKNCDIDASNTDYVFEPLSSNLNLFSNLIRIGSDIQSKVIILRLSELNRSSTYSENNYIQIKPNQEMKISHNYDESFGPRSNNNLYFQDLHSLILQKQLNKNSDWADVYTDADILKLSYTVKMTIEELTKKLKKSEFESTTNHQSRVKNINSEIKATKDKLKVELDRKRNEYANRSNIDNLVTKRELLKNAKLKIISANKYDADREIYEILTEVGLIICRLTPQQAKHFHINKNNFSIYGFSYAPNDSTVIFENLKISTSVNDNGYSCNNIQKRLNSYKPDLAENIVPDSNLEIVTNLGKIGILIDPKVNNILSKLFLDLSNSGYYNGTTIHHVVNNMIIGGGGYTSAIKINKINPKYLVYKSRVIEKYRTINQLSHDKYAFSIKLLEVGYSNILNFYINVVDNNNILDGSFFVIGKVVYGFDIIDNINNFETSRVKVIDAWPNELLYNYPTPTIIIEKILMRSSSTPKSFLGPDTKKSDSIIRGPKQW